MDQNSGFNTFFKILIAAGLLLVVGFGLEMSGHSTPATKWISDLFFSY